MSSLVISTVAPKLVQNQFHLNSSAPKKKRCKREPKKRQNKNPKIQRKPQIQERDPNLSLPLSPIRSDTLCLKPNTPRAISIPLFLSTFHFSKFSNYSPIVVHSFFAPFSFPFYAIWEIPSHARVWGCLIRIHCHGDGDLRVEVLNLCVFFRSRSFACGSLMASAQVLPNSAASSRKQEHLEAGKRRIGIRKSLIDLLNAVFSVVIMLRICAPESNVGSSIQMRLLSDFKTKNLEITAKVVAEDRSLKP
ncbi:unnamed protein product [Sphenostylis stenocarpa]|uniref:Uncharacterized protein n=1 Tax=Sphenostylis stenocarpa TaxID=92480 RepID=A0AA86VLU3_9FABA|nr:unnamed protein product [Sphenostylis stenocarpa]